MAEKEQCYVENVSGVDKNTPSTFHVHTLFTLGHMLSAPIHTPFSSIPDGECAFISSQHVK
jgi:hypothetical protein